MGGVEEKERKERTVIKKREKKKRNGMKKRYEVPRTKEIQGRMN